MRGGDRDYGERPRVGAPALRGARPGPQRAPRGAGGARAAERARLVRARPPPTGGTGRSGGARPRRLRPAAHPIVGFHARGARDAPPALGDAAARGARRAERAGRHRPRARDAAPMAIALSSPFLRARRRAAPRCGTGPTQLRVRARTSCAPCLSGLRSARTSAPLPERTVRTSIRTTDADFAGASRAGHSERAGVIRRPDARKKGAVAARWRPG